MRELSRAEINSKVENRIFHPLNTANSIVWLHWSELEKGFWRFLYELCLSLSWAVAVGSLNYISCQFSIHWIPPTTETFILALKLKIDSNEPSTFVNVQPESSARINSLAPLHSLVFALMPARVEKVKIALPKNYMKCNESFLHHILSKQNLKMKSSSAETLNYRKTSKIRNFTLVAPVRQFCCSTSKQAKSKWQHPSHRKSNDITQFVG